MKIAILGTRGIPARYGGFETFAEKLATGLSARGYDVTVFCERVELGAPNLFHGVKLSYVSTPSCGPLRTILYDIQCLWTTRKGYDVVYMLGYGAAPFCVIPRLWGTEVWINPDGLEWARSKWSFIAKIYFRLMEWSSLHAANRIIADADAIASSLAERHGRLRRCSVIRYGCEVVEYRPRTELLTEWKLTPESYYLVVCRLEPENHVLEILKAFQQSRSSRELIVVGNHLTETHYVAELLRVQDSRIRMIGTVYDEEKLVCLRCHCFAYMHGHSVGGTNPSLLEAMGCGNFVIAHDNLFNRETLGSCGVYFAKIEELTKTIDHADIDGTELASRREASQSRAREHYRWPDIVSKYVELLEKTVANDKELK